MSDSQFPKTHGRVTRGQPSRVYTNPPEHDYAKALPDLLRDFEERCAYSMIHIRDALGMEVDHFDPRKKQDRIQEYENLFPASRLSNATKKRWPNAAEERAGMRYLNPCKEQDYGVQ